MINQGKHSVLGVEISAVDYEEATRQILDAAKTRRPFGVSALAVHGVMTGAMSASHRHRLNSLEMLVPDGQPVRWGLNLLHGTQLNERVYGPQLMLETCKRAEQEGTSIFLFGGTESLLEQLAFNLTEQFPNLKIAGSMPSKFRTISAEEKREVVEEIRSSGAEISFVGIGCPRQEVWTYEFKDALQMPVIAVGAAFNFHAGLLPQAPPLLQRVGLEWLYRWTKEPVRLWKRYLLLNPFYLFLLFCQATGLKRIDPKSAMQPDREILYG